MCTYIWTHIQNPTEYNCTQLYICLTVSKGTKTKSVSQFKVSCLCAENFWEAKVGVSFFKTRHCTLSAYWWRTSVTLGKYIFVDAAAYVQLKSRVKPIDCQEAAWPVTDDLLFSKNNKLFSANDTHFLTWCSQFHIFILCSEHVFALMCVHVYKYHICTPHLNKHIVKMILRDFEDISS